MILGDTSVWIDYFNGIANRQTDHLDQFLNSVTLTVFQKRVKVTFFMKADISNSPSGGTK